VGLGEEHLIVMEYMSNGTLRHQLDSKHLFQELTPARKLNIAKHICSALIYILFALSFALFPFRLLTLTAPQIFIIGLHRYCIEI